MRLPMIFHRRWLRRILVRLIRQYTQAYNPRRTPFPFAAVAGSRSPSLARSLADIRTRGGVLMMAAGADDPSADNS